MTAKSFFSLYSAQALCLTMGLLATLPAVSDTLNIREDAPETYTVVKGDTLWDISGRYLDKPWRWPELWEGNPHIANPHLIYPGDVISLYYVDGQPKLGINRSPPTNQAQANQDSRLVKLSPQVKATPIDGAIPVVPIEDIQQLLRNLKVLDKAVIDKAPYIVHGHENRVMTSYGDLAYARGLNRAKHGQLFQIYRLGNPVKDPETGRIIAHEGIFIGDARLEQTGDPSTLLITSSKREVTPGDRLLAGISKVELSDFYPKVPDNSISAKILNVVDGAGIIGLHQTVIINAGTQQGLNRGHVLSTFTKSREILDIVSADPTDTVTLPPERSGTLMVIRPFENLSYALVMESRLPLRLLDEVRTPE